MFTMSLACRAVGIHNGGKRRHVEYFPQKPFAALPQDFRSQLLGMNRNPQQVLFDGSVDSDAYLKFLVEELKPYIDTHFSVNTDAAHTAVMGSSMGGLISVYAMNEYPQVFGGAAGLSTHWVGVFQPNAGIPLAAFNYLREHLAAPEIHRLYQDRGDGGLDAIYAPYQGFIDEIVREQGYREQGPQANYMTRVFEGQGHDETAWSARLEIPLLFLLSKQ